MSSFTLRVSEKQVEVKNHWITRWTFINDIHEEMGTTEVEWTYTPLGELRLWVELNQSMDGESRPVVPLSKIWKTIQFMLPKDDSYLEYVEIDTLIPDEKRKDLLEELGSFIRMRGVMPDYLPITDDQVDGLYFHFRLFQDPIYGMLDDNGNPITLNDMREDVRDAVLSLDLNIITGIMHQGYLNSLGKKRTKEDNWMAEIPWYYINWRDVALFTPTAFDQSDTFDSLRAIIRFDHANKQYWSADGGVTKSWTWITKEEYIKFRSVGHSLNLYTRSRDVTDELPFILGGVIRPYYGFNWSIYSTGGRVRVYIGQNNKVSLRIPRFDLFWSRITSAMIGMTKLEEYSDVLRVGLYNLIVATKLSKPIIVKKNRTESISDAIAYLNICLLTRQRTQRHIDSLEYPSICQYIAETMGTKTLEAYANYVLLLVEDDKLTEVERKRALAFASACSPFLDDGDLTEFITWPSIE